MNLSGASLATLLTCVLPVLYLGRTFLQDLTASRRLAGSAGKAGRPWQLLSGSPTIDWRFYTSWHPDVRNLTQEAALRHYLDVGRYEGRLAAPVDIRLKPIACAGLCNQLYSHIHALIIARALNASTLMLPPARRRRSFGHVYAAARNTTSVHWSFSPVEGLLDVKRMAVYWAERGLTIQPTPPLRPSLPPSTDWPGPDSKLPTAVLHYELPGGEGCMDTRLRPLKRALPLPAYLAELKAAIGADAAPLLRGDPWARIPCVYLNPRCTFMAVETVRNLTLAAEAARGLFFNRSLVALADQVVKAMDPQGLGFNGLHLRLERDARDWHQMAGGAEALIQLYLQSMKAANFSAASLVYVASGLMTYDGGAELQQVRQKVAAMGLAKRLVCKEDLLPKSALAGLHPEQLALVDLLVLLRSTRLVGFGGSSFSFLLRELRALQGRPRATAHLLYPPGLEGPLSKPLFTGAGTLSPLSD